MIVCFFIRVLFAVLFWLFIFMALLFSPFYFEGERIVAKGYFCLCGVSPPLSYEHSYIR